MQTLIVRSGQLPINHQDVEFVERKGIGHPDSLCDGIAESISSRYSQYCLEKFGVVPNHWVDKCMLIGGECSRDFGQGAIIHPLTVFVVEKVTHQIKSMAIPVEEIYKGAIYLYMLFIYEDWKDFKVVDGVARFPVLNLDKKLYTLVGQSLPTLPGFYFRLLYPQV